MQPKYEVLTRFSEEARQKVAERAFRYKSKKGDAYVCKDGLCIMGALLKLDGRPAKNGTPEPYEIAAILGVERFASGPEFTDEYRQIRAIVEMNDSYKLHSRAAVRELLGVT